MLHFGSKVCNTTSLFKFSPGKPLRTTENLSPDEMNLLITNKTDK